MLSSYPKSPLTFLRNLISFLMIGTSLIFLSGLFILPALSISCIKSYRRRFASSVTLVMLLFSFASMSSASPPAFSIKLPFRKSDSRYLHSFKHLERSTADLSHSWLLLRSKHLSGIYLLLKSD